MRAGRLGASCVVGQRAVPGKRGAERLGPPVLGDVAFGGLDDLQRMCLGLCGSRAPRRDAVPAEDGADGLGVTSLDVGDVEAQLEAWAPPRHPHHAIAEDLLGQRLTVGRGGQRDTRVGVQVVDVSGVDQAVHGGVDRRRRATAAVQAVVERRDHLVFALDPGVHVHQCAHAVQSQYREPVLGERSEITAGSLDPQQFDRLPGDRVGVGALGRGVAAGVVGVLRVRAQPVGPGDQLCDRLFGVHAHAPHDDCVPPTRSALIVSWYPDAAYAAIGSPGSPRSTRHFARAGRTSV